ncbi:hypothetical protein SAMN02745121_06188 [Nannocystis exedens]|uniref:Uncharacterized protein n=1 Tax=Nannocystis exedens TaxID=54 RepID=A0A1I2EPJ8_9BACT|nr:hypothetical protein [Nannocystis exedens]PCC73892.1 methyltransferase [Nannocystis exedens]SFE94653.1 hypothetical protein SAMN02745121_06188 [Nannocystis exedens]
MRTAAILVSISLALACGADAGKAAPGGEKKAEAPKAPEVKAPEVKAPETKTADAEPAALHLDVSHDKSGVLARAASTLETSEAVTSPALKEHLAELSHHAEKGPTNEALCAHMAKLLADKAPPKVDCIHALEHQRVHVGPEIFAEVAQCVTEAQTLEALLRCEDAEKEAERELHVKKRGSGIEAETCTKLFTHFEKLAMADAGDQAKAVEEILEEVRGDILEACAEQGTRAEVECALNAKDMKELGACQSSLM